MTADGGLAERTRHDDEREVNDQQQPLVRRSTHEARIGTTTTTECQDSQRNVARTPRPLHTPPLIRRRRAAILWTIMTLAFVCTIFGVLFKNALYISRSTTISDTTTYEYSTKTGASRGGSDSTTKAEGSSSVTPRYNITLLTWPPTTTPASETMPPTIKAPTTPTTMPPPTSPDDDDLLLKALKAISSNGLDDPTSPQYQAYLWLRNNDTSIDANSIGVARLKQKYALVAVFYALGVKMNDWNVTTTVVNDECQWPSIQCNGTLTNTSSWQLVSEIHLMGQSLNGSIAPEIGLLSKDALVKLDFSENDIGGSIPEELYNLSNLQYLYLHDNKLTGTLSEAIDNLQLLNELYLGRNQLNGTIPKGLGSRDRHHERPLRFIILRENKFHGTIPHNMYLQHLFYLDLSFNNFSGPLPSDLGSQTHHLRMLYLDHNQFNGTIPNTYASSMGAGRIFEVSLNDNALVGSVPSNWSDSSYSLLLSLEVQHNNLTAPIAWSVCNRSVFKYGEMVQLGADCNICSCQELCDGYCY